MTRARTARARLRTAQAETDSARSTLAAAAAPWRIALQRHRTALIIAGGFVSGIALSSLPSRAWRKIGGAAATCAALVARSVLTPMIAGAIVARRADGTDASPDDAGAPH